MVNAGCQFTDGSAYDCDTYANDPTKAIITALTTTKNGFDTTATKATYDASWATLSGKKVAKLK